MPERQEGVTPPACIKEVESAASACRQAQTAATRACDPQNNAALNASNQQGLAAGDRLAGTSATAGSCSTAAEHQRQYVAALDNFIQSCNGARESCSSSCSDAKSKLERCQNLATEDPGREIGEDSVACGASGPLAQKVSEATQNRNNSAAIQADGESCSSHSNATAAQTSAALGANRQKADTSGGGLGESASVNGGRQNESGSGTALQGRRAFAQNFDRQPSSAGGAGEKYNVSGAMEADADKSAAGNVGYGAGLGDLPATPAMVEGASNAEKSEVTSALGASTLGGGGVGGARLFRLPKLKGAKGLLLGEDGDKAAVNAASEEGSPDLNQFRPQMAGMKAASDIQGAHTGLFENMSKAYQRVKDTLFNEGE
ncbi:MAG: hypothetical protein KF789_09850 [Bdellovibrionaceae bacterium]|nr:hypothetical protein [Pseudobdellovibrionaceae bacterium]